MMNDHTGKMLILSLVSDLLFAVFIEDVAQKLGYQVKTLDEIILPGQPAGIEGNRTLVDILENLRPVLVLIDLGDNHLAWDEWIEAAKDQSVSRKIPVVCFGPHVNAHLLESARLAGADAVLARSRIKSSLPEIIKKYALKDAGDGA